MKKKTFSLILFLITMATLWGEESSVSEILTIFENSLNNITDYQCRMYEWSIKGKKEEIRYINFYFRSPRLIRMDIIKGNRGGDTGSIGVFLNDGKVHGRKGGILSPIAIKVNKNSPLATTIRGVTFDESDALAALLRLQYLTENSAIALYGDSLGWLFECTLYEEENGITKEVLYISKKNFMPVFTKSYEDETMVQFVRWSSYIINARLPVELFDVWYKTETLDILGIPNNINLPLDLKE